MGRLRERTHVPFGEKSTGTLVLAGYDEVLEDMGAYVLRINKKVAADVSWSCSDFLFRDCLNLPQL